MRISVAKRVLAALLPLVLLGLQETFGL